jgi:hypothetical protein
MKPKLGNYRERPPAIPNLSTVNNFFFVASFPKRKTN